MDISLEPTKTRQGSSQPHSDNTIIIPSSAMLSLIRVRGHACLRPSCNHIIRPHSVRKGSGKASADNYFKDVDEVAPPDTKTHRVDAGAQVSQRPYEPPSGPWSRAGSQTEEYRTVDRKDTYDVPSEDASGKGSADGQKLRYGGRKRYFDEHADELSSPEDGPHGASKHGRQPEER